MHLMINQANGFERGIYKMYICHNQNMYGNNKYIQLPDTDLMMASFSGYLLLYSHI